MDVLKNLDPQFKSLLKNHSIQYLHALPGSVYCTWANFRLAYLNPAWFQFAKDNGGEPNISAVWGLGRSILDSISGELSKIYGARLNQCLDSQKVWRHEYECSSDTIYRRYHQIVYPIGQHEGLLFVNSLVVEMPHDYESRSCQAVDELDYVDENNFIHQCSFCRRVNNLQQSERWDWVPEWVKQCPKHTSHTFCPSCLNHYYPSANSG